MDACWICDEYSLIANFGLCTFLAFFTHPLKAQSNLLCSAAITVLRQYFEEHRMKENWCCRFLSPLKYLFIVGNSETNCLVRKYPWPPRKGFFRCSPPPLWKFLFSPCFSLKTFDFTTPSPLEFY